MFYFRRFSLHDIVKMASKKINMYFFLSTFFIFSGCSNDTHVQPTCPRPILVTAEDVVEKEIIIYVDAIGNVQPQQTVEVRPQINGKLIETHIVPGQEVKKGDLLYTLDSSSMKANLDKAKAVFKRSADAYHFALGKTRRYADLAEKEFISQLQYEELKNDLLLAETQMAIDKAELDLAEINLTYCRICAPISGKVGEFMTHVGNNISSSDQDPITEIKQMSPIDIVFSVPQSAFQEIRTCQEECPLLFEAILYEEPEKSYKGKIHFIDNHFDSTTGTIQLKGIITNAEGILWPGQHVNVRVHLKKINNALLAPVSAISQGLKGAFVFAIKEDMSVEMKPVTLGPKIDEFWVIEKGLSLGEKVVTDGQMNLKSGMKVVVCNQSQL
jgi:membrane fusion protein, multidrug efflux system